MQSRIAAAIVAASSLVTIATAAAQTAAPDPNLTSAEVQTWCVKGCEFHRFEDLQEGGRTISHMLTGLPATLMVPAGVSVDAWDCYVTFFAVGPAQLGLCEATFRRI
jgi:hypothetical protein